MAGIMDLTSNLGPTQSAPVTATSMYAPPRFGKSIPRPSPTTFSPGVSAGISPAMGGKGGGTPVGASNPGQGRMGGKGGQPGMGGKGGAQGQGVGALSLRNAAQGFGAPGPGMNGSIHEAIQRKQAANAPVAGPNDLVYSTFMGQGGGQGIDQARSHYLSAMQNAGQPWSQGTVFDQSVNYGSPMGLRMAENAGYLGTGAGLAAGMPGLGLAGRFLGNQYLNNNVFQNQAPVPASQFSQSLEQAVNPYGATDRANSSQGYQMYGGGGGEAAADANRTFGAQGAGTGSWMPNYEQWRLNRWGPRPS